MKTSIKIGGLMLLCLFVLPSGYSQTSNPYLKVIQEDGEPPLQFIQDKLEDHDLILFDDGLHNAVEPFEFYELLLSMPDNKVSYVFLEVFGTNLQPVIDAYMENPEKEEALLAELFQNDLGGLGWRYETYQKLLSKIWDLNQDENRISQIKVIAVDQPVYWEGIHTREDYDIFLESLLARDYYMYKTILKNMDTFKNSKKGIFLTNTRHAYKNINKANGHPYWNCGTFFYKWHPGKTYSVRIHNVTLSIRENKNSDTIRSAQGLERYTYEWVRMENGRWDEAFKKNGNKAVAFSLSQNCFGAASYIGNHMLNVSKDQTLFDAYDALVFLAPLEKLHFSAKINFFYTEAFKKEIERRIQILYEGELKEFLAGNEVNTISDYIEKLTEYIPKTKNKLLEDRK